jgi:hypothetical protein
MSDAALPQPLGIASGGRAGCLGSVQAPDRETALALAYDEFETVPAQRRRIIALRASDHA